MTIFALCVVLAIVIIVLRRDNSFTPKAKKILAAIFAPLFLIALLPFKISVLCIALAVVVIALRKNNALTPKAKKILAAIFLPLFLIVLLWPNQSRPMQAVN